MAGRATRTSRRGAAGARRLVKGKWGDRLGRLGFVAKAVLYAVVALIAIEVARGEKRKAEGEEGAITALADQPFGELLLVLLALGLAGYTLWRLRIAIVGAPGESGAKDLAERAGSVALAVAYGALFVYTVRFLVTDSGGGSTEPDTVTKKLLDEPFGVALVIIGGVVLLGVAAYEAHRAFGRDFMEDLETGRMSASERKLAVVTGVAGHAALGVISGLVGFFLIKAAIEHEPREAVGLDGALQQLAAQGVGPVLLWVVAIGLLIYAAFTLIQARYRKL